MVYCENFKTGKQQDSAVTWWQIGLTSFVVAKTGSNLAACCTRNGEMNWSYSNCAPCRVYTTSIRMPFGPLVIADKRHSHNRTADEKAQTEFTFVFGVISHSSPSNLISK